MNPITSSRYLVLLLAVSTTSLAAADQSPDLTRKLNDPAPTVRKQAALTLAEANDAEAVSVLIDLLAELSAEERRPVEEFLTTLAGPWAPADKLESDDQIARQIHRDAWRAWWRNTDGSTLLALLRQHTRTPPLRRKIKKSIDKLGDDEFWIRETASKELFNLGRIALPQLREAIKDSDLEIALRARHLIERIELDSSRKLPGVAVRLLALRKPTNAAEALLAYLPLAEEDNLRDEVKKSLALLARRDGKLDPALVRALHETGGTPIGLVRAVAAEALVQGGGAEGRAAVRPMLKDKDPSLRLRIALALVAAGEREAVSVLIERLPAASEEQIEQIEDILTRLAGESAPESPRGTEQFDKKKRRDAWAAWWKANGADVEWARLTAPPWHGFTLLCDYNRNRVFELDRQGQERWAIEGVPNPVDAWVVGGNRVLIAEYGGGKVSERDFHGKILWSKAVPGRPVNVQRLANGHTFIATLNGILEVDRGGKEKYSFNVGGSVTAAYRARDGRIICLASLRPNVVECILMNTRGRYLYKFPANRDSGWTSGIDLLDNGHIVITQPNRHKVSEYDRNGKLIVEVNAPQATTATGLPNGHFLIASNATRRAYEVDRTGKEVWEYRSNGNIFRARRR